HTQSSPTVTPQVSGFIEGRTESTAQTGTTVGTAKVVQWYGFGRGDDILYKVTGTTSTTANYVATLARASISPIVVSGTIVPGSVTIAPGTGNTNDLDFWVYDSNFNAIPSFGIDSGTPANQVTRTLSPGPYYLTMTNF